MCASFNRKLVIAEDPLQDISTTRQQRDVNGLHMEAVVAMEIDLKISRSVKKLVFHQVSM